MLRNIIRLQSVPNMVSNIVVAYMCSMFYVPYLCTCACCLCLYTYVQRNESSKFSVSPLSRRQRTCEFFPKPVNSCDTNQQVLIILAYQSAKFYVRCDSIFQNFGFNFCVGMYNKNRGHRVAYRSAILILILIAVFMIRIMEIFQLGRVLVLV